VRHAQLVGSAPAHKYRAGTRDVQVGEDAKQSRLAATRRAKQRCERAGLGLEADVAQRLETGTSDLEDLVHLFDDDVDATRSTCRLYVDLCDLITGLLTEKAHVPSMEMP
jgi:hypothetical protein